MQSKHSINVLKQGCQTQVQLIKSFRLNWKIHGLCVGPKLCRASALQELSLTPQGPVPWWWLNKLRVTGLALSWQNQTTPIRLCWYHEADHQLSLSTQAWSWVNGACAHECVTSVMSSQSHALKLWFSSGERVSAIHYQRLKDWTIWRI